MDARQAGNNPLQALLSAIPLRTLDRLRVVNILKDQPAPDLLKILPAAVMNPTSHRLSDEQKKQTQESYQRARADILYLQRVVKSSRLFEKFETFSNLEGGILALMFGRLNHLDVPSIKRLLPDSADALSSAMEAQEIEKLGKARIDAIVNKISAHYRSTNKHKESDLKYLTILAILILRATDDERLQTFLVDVHCTNESENTLDAHMRQLRVYADVPQRRHIWNLLNMLEDHKSEVMIEAVIDYLLAQPDSLNNPLPDVTNSLLVNPKMMIPFAENHDGPDNYVLWSLVMLYQSWEKAFEVLGTMQAQVRVALAMRNEVVESGRDKFYKDDCSQYFVNLHGLVIDSLLPSALLLEKVDYRTSFYAADLSQTTLNFFHAGNPVGRSFQNDLTFNRCQMDNVTLKGKSIVSVNFKNLTLDAVDAEGAQFINCEFDQVHVNACAFDCVTLASSVFRNCTFDSSVSLSRLIFLTQIQDENVSIRPPVIFQGCAFDHGELSEAVGAVNARFIDCKFGPQNVLPKDAVCYQTTHKNSESIEGVFELFKIAEKANDDALTQYLQDHLLFKLRLERKLPVRDFLFCLEIFKNDPDRLVQFEKLSIAADFSVDAAFALFDDLKHAGNKEMILLLQNHFAAYLDQYHIRCWISLEQCMTCETVFDTDVHAREIFAALKLCGFDSIQGAYQIYQRAAKAGDASKIKCLQNQLAAFLKTKELKELTIDQDAQCREIFGHCFSVGYKLFDAVSSLVFDPPALRGYKAMQFEVSGVGIRNDYF